MSIKLKILLASSRAVPSGGGIASYNFELINCLNENSIFHLLNEVVEENIVGYESVLTISGKSLYNIKYIRDLITLINESNYDCIINSGSNVIALIAPYLKSPIISVSHFVDGLLALKAAYNSNYQTSIIALSKYGKSHIEKRFHIKDNQKVKVVYNFVKSLNKKSEFKSYDKPLKIVYPGGTSLAKSFDVVQKVVYLLLSSNLAFEFYWIGGTKLALSKLSLFKLNKTQDLFINDNRLIITGLIPRNKSMEILENANIFLLPSRGEGCPMTLLEAMNGGCISIVSDAKHGSREIIEQSKAGFVIPQGDYKAIFDTIKSIINNPERFSIEYNNSINFVKAELGHDIWKSKMINIINESLESPKKYITFSSVNYIKDLIIYKFISMIEILKLKIRSLRYRPQFDIAYVLNKFSYFKR